MLCLSVKLNIVVTCGRFAGLDEWADSMAVSFWASKVVQTCAQAGCADSYGESFSHRSSHSCHTGI